MKVKIELNVELPEHVLDQISKTHWASGGEANLLHNLLLDCFAEFQNVRHPPGQYVMRRYPKESPLGTYEAKVLEVEARCAVAKALHAAVFDGRITSETEPESHEPGCDLNHGGSLCSCSPYNDDPVRSTRR